MCPEASDPRDLGSLLVEAGENESSSDRRASDIYAIKVLNCLYPHAPGVRFTHNLRGAEIDIGRIGGSACACLSQCHYTIEVNFFCMFLLTLRNAHPPRILVAPPWFGSSMMLSTRAPVSVPVIAWLAADIDQGLHSEKSDVIK